MSRMCPSCAAYVPPELLPPALASGDAGSELWCQCRTDLAPVGAHSEGGWLSLVMRNVVQGPGVDAPGFLCIEPRSNPMRYRAFLVQGDGLGRVVLAVDRVFDHANSRPADFEAWLMDWTQQEILAAIDASTVTATPTIDMGSNRQTLFSCLKTIRHYCSYAADRGGGFLYLEWDN